jgi:lysophospholipase L1-like esterase
VSRFFAFGDSWTHGTGVDYEETFPYILANKLGYKEEDFINLGISGASNKIIYDQILHMRFLKTDFIFITWTSPHRDDIASLYDRTNYFVNEDMILLDNFPKYIREVESKLEGHRYKMTQCFNPIFGYDYKLETTPIGLNFIEWGNPNNTLVDIITNNWCEDNKENIWMSNAYGQIYKGIPKMDRKLRSRLIYDKKVFNTGDNHPSELGHRMIADKLLTYL